MTLLRTVPTQPFADQKLFPYGLRKPLSVFRQPHYLENAVQSFFTILPNRQGQTLVLGGDGQDITQGFLQTIIKLAAANGFGKVIVGSQGLLSPGIASYLIRRHTAIAGILIQIHASEKGGEIHLDYYLGNGSKATLNALEGIQERTQIIQHYQIVDSSDISLNRVGIVALENLTVEVINSATIYEKLMSSIFDLDSIQHFLKTQDFRVEVTCLDPINYAYSQHLLEKNLGLLPGTVTFEMAPIFLDALIGTTNLPWKIDPPDITCILVGDRYGIFGKNIGVTASDSLAILTANSPLIPAYRGAVNAITRSLFASTAVDHACTALDIICYETPTDWAFTSQLMDIQGVTFGGNEEGQIGANYSRETDGLWALLFWLNLLATRPQSVLKTVQNHWQKYGRNYHGCQLYPGLTFSAMYDKLHALTTLNLKGKEYGPYQVAYSQPLKFYHELQFQRVEQVGLNLVFTDGSRLIFKLDTPYQSNERVNLNIYAENYEPDAKKQTLPFETALSPLFELGEAIAELEQY